MRPPMGMPPMGMPPGMPPPGMPPPGMAPPGEKLAPTPTLALTLTLTLTRTRTRTLILILLLTLTRTRSRARTLALTLTLILTPTSNREQAACARPWACPRLACRPPACRRLGRSSSALGRYLPPVPARAARARLAGGWRGTGGEKRGVKRGRASRRSEARGAGGSRRARFGRGLGGRRGAPYVLYRRVARSPPPAPVRGGGAGREGGGGTGQERVGGGGRRAGGPSVCGCGLPAQRESVSQAAGGDTESQVCTSREEGATHESLLFSSIKTTSALCFCVKSLDNREP